MPRDYTDAPPPEPFELIPKDTVVTVSIHIRAGGVGEDGMLKRSREGDCEALDLEFTVLDGPYKGRKFWKYLIVSGTNDGQKKMAVTNLNILKAILDSALGLDPNDKSEEARKARTVPDGRFEGMVCMVKVGIEKGEPKKDGGFWPDKNCLAGVITKDKKDWHPVEQPPPFDGGGSSSPSTPSTPTAPVERPGWAR
jgi:hypothetical protein